MEQKQSYQTKYQEQLKALNLVGFYKIAESKDTQYYTTFKQETTDFFHLGSVTYAIFYNPDTNEVKYYWDTDWDREGLDGFENPLTKDIRTQDCPDEIYEIYEDKVLQTSIEKEIKEKEYRLQNGICSIGDTIEIYKGRKLPKGSIKVIEDIYYVSMGNSGYHCKYAKFNDGTNTNLDNCKLVKQA